VIPLGSKVRDRFTGFTGIAVAYTQWIFGCARYGVEAQQLKDGKPLEIQWFDDQRIEMIPGEAPTAASESQAVSGGPKLDPGYPANPR
jgi:hypothetical protein